MKKLLWGINIVIAYSFLISCSGNTNQAEPNKDEAIKDTMDVMNPDDAAEPGPVQQSDTAQSAGGSEQTPQEALKEKYHSDEGSPKSAPPNSAPDQAEIDSIKAAKATTKKIK